jgi:hypothetical protein
MNTPGVYKLFVYGSLRSGFKSDAYEYISRFFSFDGDAKVRENYLIWVLTLPACLLLMVLLSVNCIRSGMNQNLAGPLASLMIMKEYLLSPDEIQLSPAGTG